MSSSVAIIPLSCFPLGSSVGAHIDVCSEGSDKPILLIESLIGYGVI